MSAGLKLFAAKGFRATTVQDIAHEAKVNISLVSYHFGGKEGLLRSCLEVTGLKRLEVVESMLTPATSLEEFRVRLSIYTDEMLGFHVENPDVCTILCRDLTLEIDIIKDIFEKTFLKTFQHLVKFINSAKAFGIIKEWIDPEILASNYFGAVIHNSRHMELANTYFGKSIRDAKYRTHLRDQLVRSLIEGCCS